MGWLRLIGSLKSQVSVAEYSLFYKALVQNRPTVLRSLLIVATPYALHTTGWRRPIGCLISMGHFPQKSPMISGSFARNEMQLEASYGSSPLCTYYSSSYMAIGWLWWVGSIKLYVSFAKEPYKRDAVPQKRPIILHGIIVVHIWLCSIYMTVYAAYIYGWALCIIVGLLCKRAL